MRLSQKFIDELAIETAFYLPGEEAQLLMAPPMRGATINYKDKLATAKKSAVDRKSVV